MVSHQFGIFITCLKKQNLLFGSPEGVESVIEQAVDIQLVLGFQFIFQVEQFMQDELKITQGRNVAWHGWLSKNAVQIKN